MERRGARATGAAFAMPDMTIERLALQVTGLDPRAGERLAKAVAAAFERMPLRADLPQRAETGAPRGARRPWRLQRNDRNPNDGRPGERVQQRRLGSGA